MLKMIDARKANEITRQYIDEKNKKQLQKISDSINGAAMRGKFICSFDNLEKDVQDILKELGYKISKVDDRDGTATYNITWR